MFSISWVQKFLKNYLQGKYSTKQVVELLNKQVAPLETHIERLKQKVREKDAVINHLRSKLEEYERDR